MFQIPDWTFEFHGHKCPAMPMGLRARAAVFNALNVERTGDSALPALVDLSDDHCATCCGDGIKVITGCIFGEGNIIPELSDSFVFSLLLLPNGFMVLV